jgi:flagellar hook-length control protein FliK
MNTIAAVSVSTDLLTARPTPPAATPARGTAAADAGTGPRASRGAGAGGSAEKPDDFATALEGEMSAPEAEAAATATTRRPEGTPARGPKTDDDGDDAPPDGNGLPPWLPGMPAATLPDAASPRAAEALLAAGSRGTAPAQAPALALPAKPDLPATIEPVPSPAVAESAPTACELPAPEVAALAPEAAALADAAAVATAAADGAEPAPPAADAPDVAGPELIEALAKARPSAARAEGPTPAAPALANSTRFASPPATSADALPPSASDVARAVSSAGGVHVAARASQVEAAATPAGTERRTAPLPATPVPVDAGAVEAPVEPLLNRAVAAALAADGAAPDLKPALPDGTALAPLVGAQAPAPAAATPAPAPPLQIPVAVGAPDWDRQLGERVGVLVDQGLTNAQLKLSPAHLGPLEIRISLQNDQANVWFGTHSHATREALEAAMPKLRDMLGAQGFTNVGVSVDLQQQQAWRGSSNGQSPRYEPEFSFAAGASADAPRAERATVASRPGERSRLDAFA